MKKARHISAADREEDRKKRRRTVRIILSVLIFIMIAAITAEVIVLKNMTSVDRRFIRGVERGVAEGWKTGKSDLQLRDQGKVTDTAYLEKELEAVEEFRNKPYQDKELRKLAKRYIDDLKKCRAAAQENDPATDSEAFWDKFSGPYTDRMILLRTFYNGDYKMGSSWDSYPELRDEIFLRGWAAETAETLRFSREEGSDGNYKYTASLINGSGVDIAYMNIEVELFDSSDKAVGTAEVFKEKIKDGSKVTLVFYSSKDVASYRAAYVDCVPEEKTYE